MKPVPIEAPVREASSTAASVGNRLYGPSGAIKYLVILAGSGGGQQGCVVTAATGDDAAAEALHKHPGYKVAYVGPAADAPPSITVEAA